MKHAAILFCLLIAGCHTAPVKPSPKSTQALTRNLDSAKGSLSEADASAGRAQGHVGNARALASQFDGKRELVERWLMEQRGK